MAEPQSNSQSNSPDRHDERDAHNDAHSETHASASQDGTSGTLELEKKVQELEAQLKDKESKHLYLYADFDNYKKRAIKERSDAMKFGWENVARELLEVMDNLERGLAHMPPGTDKNLAAGLNMTLTQFRTAMQKQGVQTIEAVGQQFNPEVHDGVGQEPSDKPSGTITREQLKGYTLHGRLLRPASVIISSGPLAN